MCIVVLPTDSKSQVKAQATTIGVFVGFLVEHGIDAWKSPLSCVSIMSRETAHHLGGIDTI